MARRVKRNPGAVDNLFLLAIGAGLVFAAWKMGVLEQFLGQGGVAEPLGGTLPPPAGGGGTATEQECAQAIWDHNADLRAIEQANHPEYTVLQAVQDWWTWGDKEGATSICDYARKKGWIAS